MCLKLYQDICILDLDCHELSLSLNIEIKNASHSPRRVYLLNSWPSPSSTFVSGIEGSAIDKHNAIRDNIFGVRPVLPFRSGKIFSSSGTSMYFVKAHFGNPLF